jgi:hypothetical protein
LSSKPKDFPEVEFRANRSEVAFFAPNPVVLRKTYEVWINGKLLALGSKFGCEASFLHSVRQLVVRKGEGA